MSESSKTTTTTTQLPAEVEVATAMLQAEARDVPAVAGTTAAVTTSKPGDVARLDALMKEIDLTNSTSVLFFGTKAQQQLTAISDTMLEGVRNKDVGAAGGALNEIVAVLRGFDVQPIDPSKQPGLLARLFGKAKPVAKFLQQYETVRKQIEGITIDLERHKTKLLTDITTLDRLYQANLDYFHDLELYIAAGDAKLAELDKHAIPQLEAQAQASGEMLQAQQLRDLRAARDDLERRVHDLRLTRQVAMQSLPSIRLVQENDKGLVNKITSTVANTVPLWRQQLATAVTIHRSTEAARSVKSATDLTNQLLEANAEALKLGNREARTQIERSVFDIESIKKANQMLIDTIEESLKIADEGKRRRQEALTQLETCESELKKTLGAASARTT
jgi:uncharacterized protein YaaN involved in tellurite resistance